ncbi:MAG: dTDP-glucose 4,6-dehydratase [Fimbriimonadaceae bacterium]|nr:dTDP-glucose 4,6-dehydratase [Fimbriimonadaceae bacterium]
MRVLVTGAAGFIGSHFVRVLQRERPTFAVAVFDALTYSGNRSTVESLGDIPFFEGRIEDAAQVAHAIETFRPDAIVNFAAESHNDRSLDTASSFLVSNAIGVETLLNAVKTHGLSRIVHVSTDEVYGSIPTGKFFEDTPIAPNTPYSASKAAGDCVCRAHFHAYRTPVVVTRGGNTYGPYQYPEKLIPFFTVRLLLGKKVPVYGDGTQVREWIHAEDHARGILAALEHGKDGEIYNIGDENERQNREIVEILLRETDRGTELVKHIEDPRKGAHDVRYSMDHAKATRELGWKPQVNFLSALPATVAWYRANEAWWRPITENADYQAFIERYYGRFLGEDL